MKVQDAMAKTISTAEAADTIGDVAKLMKKEDAGFIPVVEDGRLVGVVTDRDIVLRCIAEGENPIDVPVRRVMSTNVATVQPGDDLEQAAQKMDREEIRRLAVVEDGGRVVGVLSHGNLVQATQGQGAAKEATTGVTRGA